MNVVVYGLCRVGELCCLCCEIHATKALAFISIIELLLVSGCISVLNGGVVDSCLYFYKSIYIPTATHTSTHSVPFTDCLFSHYGAVFISCLLVGWLWLRRNNTECSLLTRTFRRQWNEQQQYVCMWCVQNSGHSLYLCVSNIRFTWSIQPFLVSESIQRCVLLNVHLMEDSCLHILLHRQLEWRKCA